MLPDSETTQKEVNTLIESALPNVKRIVRKASSSFPRHVDQDELYGAGCLGLVEAAQRFDPSKGFSFSSWAEFRIRGAVLDYARSQDRLSQVARRDARKLTLETESFVANNGRPPTVKELGSLLGWTQQKVQDTRANLEKSRTVSLSAPAWSEDDQDRDIVQEADHEENVENQEIYILLRRGVGALEPRQREIIEGIFVEGLPMKDLAEKLNLSIGRIAQIRNDALEALRVAMMECMGDEIVEEYYAERDFETNKMSKRKQKERDRMIGEMMQARSEGPAPPVAPKKPSRRPDSA